MRGKRIKGVPRLKEMDDWKLPEKTVKAGLLTTFKKIKYLPRHIRLWIKWW